MIHQRRRLNNGRDRCSRRPRSPRRSRRSRRARPEVLKGDAECDWQNLCLWVSRQAFLRSRFARPYQVIAEVNKRWRGARPSRSQEEEIYQQIRRKITEWRRDLLVETQNIIRRWCKGALGSAWLQGEG